jgi:hypothetical protein
VWIMPPSMGGVCSKINFARHLERRSAGMLEPAARTG